MEGYLHMYTVGSMWPSGVDLQDSGQHLKDQQGHMGSQVGC